MYCYKISGILLICILIGVSAQDLSCPPYFSAFPTHVSGTITCLHINNTDATWNQHRSVCEFTDSYLMMDVTSFLQIELANYFPRVEGYENTTFFAGGHDFMLDGTWEWNNGEPMDDVIWADGEPSGGISANCACLCPPTFLMCSCPCDEEDAAICQTEPSIGYSETTVTTEHSIGTTKITVTNSKATSDSISTTTTAVDPDTTTLPPYEVDCPFFYSVYYLDEGQNNPTCLRIVDEDPDTWNSHRAHCLDEDAYLVKTTPALQKQLADYFPLVPDYAVSSFFVGGSDVEIENQWIWLDESNMDNVDWAIDQPDGGTDENCACLCPSSFLMCDCNCNELNFAICQTPGTIRK